MEVCGTLQICHAEGSGRQPNIHQCLKTLSCVSHVLTACVCLSCVKRTELDYLCNLHGLHVCLTDKQQKQSGFWVGLSRWCLSSVTFIWTKVSETDSDGFMFPNWTDWYLWSLTDILWWSIIILFLSSTNQLNYQRKVYNIPAISDFAFGCNQQSSCSM